MYDTLRLWIGGSPNESPFEKARYLTELTEHRSEVRGYSCTGKIRGCFVRVSENGISLECSLAKFALGNNIESLTRNGTRIAIEELSDCLHLDIGEAKVKRVDVAGNVLANHKPKMYYRYLGEAPLLQRSNEHPDTLYYKNGKRQLVFYDKGAEAIKENARRYKIILGHTNLLRYELRFMKDINRQLNNNVLASKLSDEAFYRDIARRWHEGFAEIQKLKKQSFMIGGIKGPREAKDALLAYFLQQDEQGVADDFFNALRENNAFGDRKYYSRLKTTLNKLRCAPRGIEGELLSELDSKIHDIAIAAMDE
jgi:hypothetical protein